MLDLALSNLTSPMVLAFALGAAATLARSDLRLPEAIYQFLSVYLLFAIGLKGGHALAQANPADVVLPAAAAVAMGTGIAFAIFPIARRLGRLNVQDAASLTAHYGSVSVVTFTVGVMFLDRAGVTYEGYLPLLLALLEAPAIVVALLLAQRGTGRGNWGSLHEVIAGRSIVLLAGGILVGVVAGVDGYDAVRPFFIDPFLGILTLFLLEMGVVAASRLSALRESGRFLVAFALLAPVVQGAIGVALGTAIGLSLGGATLLGVLAGSASYIAAPAAVRLALPQANVGYSLAGALAITFPFNLLVGIPLYYGMASALHGLLA